MYWLLVLTAFSGAVSLISGLITLYDRSRLGSQSQQTKIALGFTLATLVVTFIFLFAGVQSLQGNSPGNNFTPTAGVTQQSTGVKPGQTAQTQAQPTATPTSAPKPGDVLYQADQSHGWNGWSGSTDWRTSSNGFLTNDGTNNSTSTDPTIIAPISLQGISDYAVEIKMQLITTLDPTVTYSNFPCFNILVRGNSTTQGWEGYEGGFYCYYPPYNAWLKDAQYNSSFTPSSHAPFDPQHSWHTYRVEVKGSEIRLLIDGGLKADMTDVRYPSGGQVGLEDFMLQAQISSFKIIAL